MLNFKKLCTYYQIATAFLLSAFSIYAIIGGYDNQLNLFPALITKAQAQTAQLSPLNSAKIAKLKQSAHGFYKNLQFSQSPYNVSHLSFTNENNVKQNLGAFNGKILLVNFWAIWCPPCRKEMPELAHLKTALASKDFDVITLNVDTQADDAKLNDFLQSISATNLPLYRDTNMAALKQLRYDDIAFGLPLTLLIDEKGNLLAYYNGAAPWGNDDAINLIKTAIDLKNSPEN